jgi:hypothetical protein
MYAEHLLVSGDRLHEWCSRQFRTPGPALLCSGHMEIHNVLHFLLSAYLLVYGKHRPSLKSADKFHVYLLHDKSLDERESIHAAILPMLQRKQKS